MDFHDASECWNVGRFKNDPESIVADFLGEIWIDFGMILAVSKAFVEDQSIYQYNWLVVWNIYIFPFTGNHCINHPNSID